MSVLNLTSAIKQVRAAQGDATLGKPKLILLAVQVNMRAGRLPQPEANGMRYLRFPLDAL